MTQPTGTCVCCAQRPPRWGLVCDACRSRLRRWLAEIPDLCADLAASDPAGSNFNLDHRADPDHTPADHRTGTRAAIAYNTGRRTVIREPGWPADPVATALPPGPLRGAQNGGRVSGSRYPSAPADLAAADLLAPARHGSRAPHARGVLGLDDTQIGDLSVATVLDTWVRDWREVRNRGEGLPAPDVTTLSRWLTDRLDWACDEHPAVDEFASELREVRTALYGRLGLHDVPDYKQGVPCPGCDTLALVRRAGSDWIECGACPALLSPEEYTRWCGLCAAEAKRTRKDDAA